MSDSCNDNITVIDLSDYTDQYPTSALGNMSPVTLDDGVMVWTSTPSPNYNTSVDWNTLTVAPGYIPQTRSSNTLSLQGDGADIDINGVSLKDTLQQIQERLAILQPNAELESRWQQLRDLREQYQALEQDLLQKEQAWQALQQQG